MRWHKVLQAIGLSPTNVDSSRPCTPIKIGYLKSLPERGSSFGIRYHSGALTSSDGQPVAILITRDMYDRIVGSGQSWIEFMRSSLLYDQDDVTLVRDQSNTRDVSF